MQKWLNYHHLYYFLKIAELGSVSKAAQELRIGQPSLSSQLKELEENLGLLFERKNRGLHLNERGRIVLKYAKDIFSRGEELLSVLQRGELAINRQVIVGAQDGVPKAITTQTLSRLQKKYDAKIKIIEGDAAVLIEDLLQGRVDFVIFDQELSHTEGTIHYLPLGTERLCIYGSEKFRSLAKKFPQSLSRAPFVLTPTGHPLRQKVEHFFLSHEINLNIVAEAPDTALIKEMAAHEMGVVALGETTVRSWVRAGRLYKIGNLPFGQEYWLGLPKRSLKDPLADVLRKEFTKGT